MSEEKHDFTVLGRTIGKATGWDLADTFQMMLYGLVPARGYKGPTGDVCVNFEYGVIEKFDEDGQVVETVSVFDAMKDAPRAPTAQ